MGGGGRGAWPDRGALGELLHHEHFSPGSIERAPHAPRENTSANMTDDEPSYIDYEAFLDPDFSAYAFANSLVLNTNNPNDTPLDLSTPLSRVLFDVQEIDTHIDTLTTKSALPLLEHTQKYAGASNRILETVEEQVQSLTDSYKNLEKEVIERHEAAEQVRIAAERLCETLRLGRAVGRALMLGRQLEAQMSEVQPAAGKKEDHRAMTRSANTLLQLRQLFAASKPGEEGEGLERVDIISTLTRELITPSERSVVSKSQQIISQFSMSSLANTASASSLSTYAQTEDMRSKATSALNTLYLLSPTTPKTTHANFEPSLMIGALQDYLQTALRSSLASLARALAQLPALERTLLEIAARCQNIVALEALLDATKTPAHSLFTSSSSQKQNGNLLQPLLHSLDTSSLPSYFWRTLASALGSRVLEIVQRGGVSARTLRSNKERVRDAIRDCVEKGSRLPPAAIRGLEKEERFGGWEREAAVMVGAVLQPLGR